MSNLVLIAAVGLNNELGKNNNLIWNLKEDMKFFRENTIGKPIVMGRKTLESLPRLLPDRLHIVLTKGNILVPGIIVVHNNLELFDVIKDMNKEVMVIGGGSIYQLLINDADKLLLTEIDESDHDADVFFPEFDKSKYKRKILKRVKENNILYNHVEYKRDNI